MKTLLFTAAGFFAGFLFADSISLYLLGTISPRAVVAMLEKQCDGGKIANERQYDCHASINAVLRYKDGRYTLEWLEDGGVQKKE